MKYIWKLYCKMDTALHQFRRNEKGQALSEYAIIIGVIAVLIIATLVLFKDALGSLFTRIIKVMNGVGVSSSS